MRLQKGASQRRSKVKIMKNLKKLTSIILALCLVMCFTGCIKMDVGVNVKEDGTASMTAKMSISEDLYLLMSESSGDESDEESVNINQFKKETVDGETYYSYSETKEYENYSDLIADLRKLEVSDGMQVFDAVQIDKSDDGTYIFKVTTAIVDAPSDSTGDMEIPDDWFALTLTVKMPGKITEVIGGEELEDGSVRFTLKDFTEKKNLSVQSEVEQFNVTRSIIIWIVGLSIIAVVVTMRFKQKKQDDKAIATEEKEANENTEN